MKIELDIRLADRDDLAEGKNLRIGRLYFLKSKISNRFEGPYYLYRGMDVMELKNWLDQKMIYVMKSTLNQNINIKTTT